MIRIIKSATNYETDEVIIHINIDVYHYLYEITSSINIGYDASGQLDRKSQRDYDNFVQAITKYMKSLNFTPVLDDSNIDNRDSKDPEWDNSPNDGSISKYSTWTKDSVLMDVGKTYIVRIRVSNHPLSENGYDREYTFYRRKDNQLREQVDTLRQKGKPAKDYLPSQAIEIRVDKEWLNSYKEALEFFKKELRRKSLI